MYRKEGMKSKEKFLQIPDVEEKEESASAMAGYSHLLTDKMNRGEV